MAALVRATFAADALPQRLIMSVDTSAVLGPPSGSAPLSYGSVGKALLRSLLAACGPSPSDIHDSDNAKQRSRFRDKNGFNRPRTFQYTLSKRKAYRYKGVKHCESWDTHAFMDFGAVWCDRLLLGGAEAEGGGRSALLLPYGSAIDHADSLRKVLLAFPHLQRLPHRLLLTTYTGELPLGAAYLGPLGDDCMEQLVTPHVELRPTLRTLNEMTNDQAVEAWVLWIGVRGGSDERSGSFVPLRREMTGTERNVFDHRVVPRLLTALGLWATNPQRAAEFVATPNEWESWSGERKSRVKSSLLQSMISTRDEHILRCYNAGVAVSKRVGLNASTLLAHQVAARLEAQVEQKLPETARSSNVEGDR